jgi:hypothetical protein
MGGKHSNAIITDQDPALKIIINIQYLCYFFKNSKELFKKLNTPNFYISQGFYMKNLMKTIN